jgi:hypothetical protein
MAWVEHLDGHRRLAAEFPRQRPLRSGAVGEDAAENTGAGRRAGDLFHFRLAVHREETHTERKGARDVALLLDGVAIGDAVHRAAGRQHHLDLSDRGCVEAGAKRSQQQQQFRCRVRLHGVEHPAVGESFGKGAIIVAHDVEIDDEARPVIQPAFVAAAQEVADALGHWRAPSSRFKGPFGPR